MCTPQVGQSTPKGIIQITEIAEKNTHAHLTPSTVLGGGPGGGGGGGGGEKIALISFGAQCSDAGLFRWQGGFAHPHICTRMFFFTKKNGFGRGTCYKIK